jgi:hypothetical protein
MNNKRGISATVTMILIILITVAAVGIIWVTIVPMIRESAVFEDYEVNLIIESEGGYTFYDSDNGMACIQVRRGDDETNLSRIDVLFVYNGTSVDEFFNFSGGEIPGINEAKTKCFDLSAYGDSPDSASIAPVFLVGGKDVARNPTSKIDFFKEGTYSEGECSATVSCSSTSYVASCFDNIAVNQSTSYSCVGGSCVESVANESEEDCSSSGKTCSGGSCVFTNIISSCPRVLDQPGTVYVLDRSISHSDTCLTVSAEGISVDLSGYEISGTGSGSGILVENDSVSIYGGTISNFYTGIFASYVDGVYVYGMDLNSNYDGIHIDYTGNSGSINTIENNNIFESSNSGISLNGNTNGDSIQYNIISNSSTYGIYVGGQSSNNYFYNNSVCGTLSYSIYCSSSDISSSGSSNYFDYVDSSCGGWLFSDNGYISCPVSGEIDCSDGTDNDANGDTDCYDFNCNGYMGNMTSGANCEYGMEYSCSDEFDNDANGDADCADSNCGGAYNPNYGYYCEYGSEMSCNDGYDNDGDGNSDCSDSPDCDGASNCVLD